MPPESPLGGDLATAEGTWMPGWQQAGLRNHHGRCHIGQGRSGVGESGHNCEQIGAAELLVVRVACRWSGHQKPKSPLRPTDVLAQPFAALPVNLASGAL